MRRLCSLFTMGALTVALMAGCGEVGPDSSEVRARNLKTGEVHTFSAGSEVPDGYAVCADEECSVPEQVPCELLGAEVCQYQPNCRIKILSCTSGGNDIPVGCAEPALPSEPDSSKPSSNNDPAAGCVLPEKSEVCQVACIPKGYQLCQEITDAQICASRPECDWLVADCAMCACADNSQPCDCPPCNLNNGFCQERKQISCEQITDQNVCLGNPSCGWGGSACAPCECTCACPANDSTCECAPCKCMDDCQQGCFTRPDAFCEGLDSELSCQGNPACEWGQFECPPCMFGQPADSNDPNGAPVPCDCGLSCRTKRYECPPVPAITMVCPPDQHAEPMFDEMGCLIGWKCTNEPICPPMPMYYPMCEDGSEPLPIYDTQGCQIGWDCTAQRLCDSSSQCPAGFQCIFNGGSAPNGGATDLAAQGKCVPCSPVMCEMFCEFGFAQDENGCSVCSCNPVPNTPCKRTGCSGQICSDQDVASTCEFIEYYKCYDLAECGQNANGVCGWIANPAFTQCMTDMGQMK